MSSVPQSVLHEALRTRMVWSSTTEACCSPSAGCGWGPGRPAGSPAAPSCRSHRAAPATGRCRRRCRPRSRRRSPRTRRTAAGAGGSGPRPRWARAAPPGRSARACRAAARRPRGDHQGRLRSELLAGTGSVAPPVTPAVLVSVPVAVGLTVTCTVTLVLALGASGPACTSRCRPRACRCGKAGLEDTNDTCGGNVSVIVIDGDVDGPRFVAWRVYASDAPCGTGSGESAGREAEVGEGVSVLVSVAALLAAVGIEDARGRADGRRVRERAGRVRRDRAGERERGRPADEQVDAGGDGARRPRRDRTSRPTPRRSRSRPMSAAGGASETVAARDRRGPAFRRRSCR